MRKLLLASLLVLPFISSCGGDNAETYIVTWDLDNGSALFKEEYKRGEIPSYKGITPTKERTNLTEEDKKAGKDDCSYTFKGWDKEFVPVVADTTYKAVYNAHSYVTKISFKADTIGVNKKVGFDFAYTAGENDIFVNWGDQQYSTHEDVTNNHIEHTYQIDIRKDFSILVYGSITSLKNLNTSEVPVGLEFSNTHSVIDSYSFLSNVQITSIFVSRTIKMIGGFAFKECSNLSSVTFEEGSQLETIGEQAFFEASALTCISIPKSVKTIGGFAFERTALTCISIPKSVKTIGGFAFKECSNLSSVTFEEGSQLETIGEQVFLRTALTRISIPKSVKTIVALAFKECSNLSSVTFEEGSQLETIGEQAFFEASALTRISIPKSVKTIDVLAFYGNSNLTVVDLTEFTDENIEKIPNVSGAFDNCSSSLKFYVTNEKMKAIFTDPSSSWVGYADRFTTDPVPAIY